MLRMLCILCLLAGCGRTAPETAPTSAAHPAETQAAESQSTGSETAAAVPAVSAVRKDLPPVDFDLTQTNRTMMYAQAYDMIYNTEEYLGKTVRICGPFNTYTDEETGDVHRAILIRDATACCTQGIEFEPADPNAVMPAIDAEMTVSGVFDTYMIGPFLYCILRDATIDSM